MPRGVYNSIRKGEEIPENERKKKMRKYITAKFLNTSFNTVFEQDFNNYTEFENFIILNRQYVLLNVSYAR